jgi:hypothetical protein
MERYEVINEGKNRFKDTIILLITLIIPLTVAVIAIYAGYYIPSTASLAAQENCHIGNNTCVIQQTYTTTSNEFTNLGRYLGQAFIILFVLVALLLFYTLFARGWPMYIAEVAMAILLIWDFLFLIALAYFNGAVYTPIVNGSNGVPVNSTAGGLFSIAIWVFRTTDKIITGQFIAWYIILFFVMFLELVVYTLIRAKTAQGSSKYPQPKGYGFTARHSTTAENKYKRK